MSRKPRVAVLGAGISGISTAYEILGEFKNLLDLTVIADEFVPAITSSMAAGLWMPYSLSNTPEHLQRRWGKKTFDHLHFLSHTENTSETGIYPVSGCYIYSEEVPVPSWADLVFGFRKMTQEEMAKYPSHKMGFAYTSYICEPVLYIPWLTEKIKAMGGKLKQERIDSLSELVKDFDIVVNCSGIGARTLGFEDVYPARGQMMRVEAPWVKHFVVSLPDQKYILPLSRGVVLGGTGQNNMNRNISLEDTKAIWDGCCKLMPSLKKSQIFFQGVGIRPMRDAVRVELEKVNQNGITKFIVHNYGHGGAGITLHKGCAEDAVNLVKQALSQLPTSRL